MRKVKTPSLELTVIIIGGGAICNSVIFANVVDYAAHMKIFSHLSYFRSTGRA